MFKGNEPHEVPPERGKSYIRTWLAAHPNTPIRAHFFGRQVLMKLLREPGVVGLRFHHAQSEQGAETLVITGVDSDGKDLWEGTVAEQALPCPPLCSDADV